MSAVTYQGPNKVEVTKVPDAAIEKRDDIVVRMTSTAICGSDLHLYKGNFPLPHGYVIGHEPMGGGADAVIDCVGMDGKKTPLEYIEQKLKLQGGMLGPIQFSTKAVRKFGTVQLTGVYGGNYNLFPLGAFFSRNITLRMGQAPVIHYMPELFRKIMDGEFDPKAIVTHRLPLGEASHAYSIFNGREDNCIKVVLKP
ncbi:alcohol dehydrogenase catalytic domain-containing protein [Cohnella sp. AR92]|uniref:alcohol dehydrogenase catalytic domain-containing protein n=1 Tax=Cohnella sp. AR92 TaxID=648716 RepID=UPI000F8EFCCA|nr:alcohol dehydrogenase catalytic domain-containing protein [Cohnella sp. AR92]RUS48598.1 hypothetical protein ELR57_04080 [Cohnella sp. AR92]